MSESGGKVASEPAVESPEEDLSEIPETKTPTPLTEAEKDALDPVELEPGPQRPPEELDIIDPRVQRQFDLAALVQLLRKSRTQLAQTKVLYTLAKSPVKDTDHPEAVIKELRQAQLVVELLVAEIKKLEEDESLELPMPSELEVPEGLVVPSPAGG